MQPAKSMRQLTRHCKQKLAFFLIAVIVMTHALFILPFPALASNSSLDWAQAHLNGSFLEQQILEHAKQTLNATQTQLSKALSEQDLHEQAKKLIHSTQIQLSKISADQNLVAQLSHSIGMTSGTFCKAYTDSLQGVDNAMWDSIVKSAGVIFTIAQATPSASIAGAETIAEYAGLVSVISQMGLGEVMTVVAGLMGSDVAGAAATAVVTSAIGGPVVMGAILAGGTVVTTYGTYKLGQFTAEKFGSWAGDYCSLAVDQ